MWAALLTLSGLVVGNFTYAALLGGSWPSAFERSFFQVVAVACVLVSQWMARQS